MEYQLLGSSDLRVSRICLGTMTWGGQNTETEAHQQLDLALDAGVNFIDTAEMYPIPPGPETQGLTESWIGSWLRARQRREDVVIATKATGPAEAMKHIRGGPRLDRSHLRAALEASLERLGTDYIDLYQLHWPERKANYFGSLGYRRRPADESDVVPLEESLGALAELVQEGKIRHVGLSNETPWGVMHCLRLAAEVGLPKPVSVQNPYNLLNRTFEVGLAEVALRESVDLLAYSPLAFGVLSGKYLQGARPEGARISRYPHYRRYLTPPGEEATAAYVALARDWGLDPAQMALAFVNAQPFVGSNIIGATSLAQLQANLDSLAVSLSEAQLEAIEAVHSRYSNPCP